MNIQDPVILIVDDSTNDVLLMRIVFERAGLKRPLQFASGGEAAFHYLAGAIPYADRDQFPLPSIVLLDLNMPGTNGFEVLQWIRQHPEFAPLPIYVLSASSRPEDIERAYLLGADSYLVKPTNLDGLLRMAKSIVAWLKISHFAPLPSRLKIADHERENVSAPPEYRQDRVVG